MKYKLKRSPATLFIFSAIAVFIMLYSIYETSAVSTVSFSSVFALLVSAGIVVYEGIKLKKESFFFDDDTFSIQGESYTYSQIDYLEVYSPYTRYFHTEKIDIYVDGKCVFRFNKGYDNSGKFLVFAQKHSVRIKVGLGED
jgi:hypothetical protein